MIAKNKKKTTAKKKNLSSMGIDDFGAYLPDEDIIKKQKRAFRGREYTEKEFREYNLKRQEEEDDRDDKYDLLTYAEKI